MAHDDQFTATGPPLTGSGFPRSGFSTRATGMVYGANVQGDQGGVYAESVRGVDTGRDAEVEGVGVWGEGDNFGVVGRIHGSEAGSEIAGVVGQHNRAGVGAVGAALDRAGEGGIGIAGLSHSSLNPQDFGKPLPDPARGAGTGVFGSSGTGTGVRGTSADGVGVEGSSRSGRGGVFESGGGADGEAVGQVGLVPQRMSVPDVVPASPVAFDSVVSDTLPREGRAGDLLVTQGQDDSCALWLCTRGQEGDRGAQWSQVLVGPPMERGADQRSRCESLTRPAIKGRVDAVDNALEKAEENERLNGPQAPGAQYPGAATLSVENLTSARAAMGGMLDWLDEHNLFEPDPPGYVTNTSAAYHVYNAVREAVHRLHHGRHWAAVSAGWNSVPPRDPRAARECVDLTSVALVGAEPLGSEATRCYVDAYVRP